MLLLLWHRAASLRQSKSKIGRTSTSHHTLTTSSFNLRGIVLLEMSLAEKSTTNAVITTAIRLRSDYDVSHAPASNSTQSKNEHFNFRHSTVVSQSNRMHIVISITSVAVDGIVASSYRSLIAIVT